MIESNLIRGRPCSLVSTELKSLGERIRHLRQSLKISQEELAARCALHRTYVSDLERGTRNLSFLSLLAVAQGLDVTVSELTRDIGITGAADPSPPKPEPGSSARSSVQAALKPNYLHAPPCTSESE
jgi:transcriptional regulator with XRE-family HTH domain